MSHVFIQQIKRTVATSVTCLRERSQSMPLIFLHASSASRVVTPGLYQIL